MDASNNCHYAQKLFFFRAGVHAAKGDFGGDDNRASLLVTYDNRLTKLCLTDI